MMMSEEEIKRVYVEQSVRRDMDKIYEAGLEYFTSGYKSHRNLAIICAIIAAWITYAAITEYEYVLLIFAGCFLVLVYKHIKGLKEDKQSIEKLKYEHAVQEALRLEDERRAAEEASLQRYGRNIFDMDNINRER